MYTIPSISSACLRSGIASQRRMNSSLVKQSPSRSGGGRMWAVIGIGISCFEFIIRRKHEDDLARRGCEADWQLFFEISAGMRPV